jgi:hypothetical protein
MVVEGFAKLPPFVHESGGVSIPTDWMERGRLYARESVCRPVEIQRSSSGDVRHGSVRNRPTEK